jgi:aspartate-semialdehyde dehydrogenase
VIFLAAAARETRKLAPHAQLIDLTYSIEDMPGARLRAPMAEPAGYRGPASSVHVIPNAASIALAVVLSRLHAAHKLRHALAHVFEPTSERGAGGLEELQQQTIGLLSFKGQPKEIFDAQVAFNMLARYGEEAPVALEETAMRIERHLATLLSFFSGVPMPSIRVLQAPVFHGYSISLWTEFEEHAGAAGIEQALEGEPIDVRAGDAEPPNAVGMAGQGGVTVGAVAVDRNNAQAAWLWMVADNLRLRAENAITLAQRLL